MEHNPSTPSLKMFHSYRQYIWMLARTIHYSAVAHTPVTRSANSRFPTKNEGGNNFTRSRARGFVDTQTSTLASGAGTGTYARDVPFAASLPWPQGRNRRRTQASITLNVRRKCLRYRAPENTQAWSVLSRLSETSAKQIF